MDLRRHLTLWFLLLLGSGVMAQIINVPNVMHDRTVLDQSVASLDFIYFPYSGPDIRLTELKKHYPQLTAPDRVQIIPPDLSGYGNVYVFIGLLDPSSTTMKEVVIMIVGNYLSRKLTYFVDNNMDRDYNNDQRPFSQYMGDKPELVELRPYGESSQVFDMWLSADRLQGENYIKKRKLVERIRNQFSISGQVGVTAGKLTYRYINTEIGFPTWYQVNSTGKSIGLNIDYTHEVFRVGIGAAYQHMYYWTSYLKKRTGLPEVYTDPRTGRTFNISNVTTVENRDKHATDRLELSAKASLLIPIARIFDLQPYVKGGMVIYGQNAYTPNHSLESVAYKEGNDYFYEFGFQVDVASGMEHAAYVGIGYNQLIWQPEGFFETIPHEDLEIEYRQLRFFLGYRFGL